MQSLLLERELKGVQEVPGSPLTFLLGIGSNRCYKEKLQLELWLGLQQAYRFFKGKSRSVGTIMTSDVQGHKVLRCLGWGSEKAQLPSCLLFLGPPWLEWKTGPRLWSSPRGPAISDPGQLASRLVLKLSNW